MPARKPRIEYKWRWRYAAKESIPEVTCAVMTACGCEPLASVNMYFREVGPGPKPQ